MNLRNLTPVLLQIALAAAVHQHPKRSAETNATLYAYGTNSSSWPISYGLDDGM